MNQTPYQKSIQLLSKRDYSEAKLKSKLQTYGYDESEIIETITILKNKKFLNEKEYIRGKIIASLKRNYSSQYIYHKLKSEGLDIDSETIKMVREEISLHEEQQILNLITKKLSSNTNKIEKNKLKNKVASFLNTKGFEYHDYEDALEKAINDI